MSIAVVTAVVAIPSGPNPFRRAVGFAPGRPWCLGVFGPVLVFLALAITVRVLASAVVRYARLRPFSRLFVAASLAVVPAPAGAGVGLEVTGGLLSASNALFCGRINEILFP